MDRLERVRQVVDDILRQQPVAEESRCGFVHLYGVAATCVLLALKRGLDPEPAALAGMLHDIWSYKTGTIDRRHAIHSAGMARDILAGLGDVSEDEIAAICGAVARHSDKEAVDGELAELLKDADVLQHHVYNPALAPHWSSNRRLVSVLAELGLRPATI